MNTAFALQKPSPFGRPNITPNSDRAHELLLLERASYLTETSCRLSVARRVLVYAAVYASRFFPSTPEDTIYQSISLPPLLAFGSKSVRLTVQLNGIERPIVQL